MDSTYFLRSRERKFCCPGWSQRGISGLCLVPICTRGCGNSGKCIKPNLCVCDGGKIGSRCGSSGGSGRGGLTDDDQDELGSGGGIGAVEDGGCRSTCLNGGTCKDGSCVCRLVS